MCLFPGDDLDLYIIPIHYSHVMLIAGSISYQDPDTETFIPVKMFAVRELRSVTKV